MRLKKNKNIAIAILAIDEATLPVHCPHYEKARIHLRECVKANLPMGAKLERLWWDDYEKQWSVELEVFWQGVRLERTYEFDANPGGVESLLAKAETLVKAAHAAAKASHPILGETDQW